MITRIITAAWNLFLSPELEYRTPPPISKQLVWSDSWDEHRYNVCIPSVPSLERPSIHASDTLPDLQSDTKQQ